MNITVRTAGAYVLFAIGITNSLATLELTLDYNTLQTAK